MTSRTAQLLQLTAGERLVRARKTIAGLTQDQMAEQLGVDRRTVGRWERSNHLAPRPLLIAWASVTDVPVVWLERGVVPEASSDTSSVTREDHGAMGAYHGGWIAA
jgi:transcriptional regulator with XRE-family HTH domain